ncbi:MAG: diguanylate cyclase, partial [Actinomycetota bacterium]|nr:diguanylate cyclase [Actinomycetota bacterium]
MPAIIFHFSVRFTGNEINKIQKICINSFYSLSLILSILLIAFKQIGIQKVTYGYAINAPLLMFIQLFFIIPVNIAAIFIISRKIYQNVRANKPVIDVTLFLTGLIFYFLTETIFTFLIENGVMQPVPVTWASSLILYLFISFGFVISNFRLWKIAQDIIFKNMEDAVLTFDTSDQLVELNKSACSILNLDKKKYKKEKLNIEYVLDNLSKLITDSKERKNFIESKFNIKSCNYKEDIEFRINGEKKYYNVKVSPILDKFNITTGKLLTLTNITSEKEKEIQLYYQAYHDKLTGTYNRLFFEEEMKRLDTKRMYPISIIIGDINGLKLINEAYGYNKGDEVLKKAATILKNNLRHEDILCRWGGDEFALILPNTKKEDSIKIINRIKESCIKNSTESIPLNISMGFAVKKSSKKKINEIAKEAEDMMNKHKLLENESARSSIILSLQKALEERDYETEEHAMRMANLSMLLGEKLKLNYNDLNELRLIAMLHDIGKISISDNIILKPGKLTLEEWEAIKKHPEAGYRLAISCRDL